MMESNIYSIIKKIAHFIINKIMCLYLIGFQNKIQLINSQV